jgi:predicted nuclease of predicted toxin-antitoxin system
VVATQRTDATHLRDEGLQTLEDEEIFKKAALERRIILTFDLDFGEIAGL